MTKREAFCSWGNSRQLRAASDKVVELSIEYYFVEKTEAYRQIMDQERDMLIKEAKRRPRINAKLIALRLNGNF